jgi:hypothetical protein
MVTAPAAAALDMAGIIGMLEQMDLRGRGVRRCVGAWVARKL